MLVSHWSYERKRQIIQITVLVLLALFFFLWLLFTILYATKHDTSSSFLLTGTSSSSISSIQDELKTRLSKKFHVNDLELSKNNNQVTAVFSVRGKKTKSDLNTVISGIPSTILTDSILTDGSNTDLVCVSYSFLTTTTHPNLVTTTTTILPSTPSTTIITTSKPITPLLRFYCNDTDLQRDIVVVFDTLSVVDKKALNVLKEKMSSGFNFGPTRVFIMGADSFGPVTVSTDFASTAEQFEKDFDKMLNMNLDNGSTLIATDPLFGNITKLPFRRNTPRAVFIMTSHSMGFVTTPENKLNQKGYFVAIATATMYKITGLEALVTTGIMSFTDWTSLATVDPFSKFTCQYVWEDNSASSLNQIAYTSQKEFLQTDSVDNSCEKVDISFLFDASVASSFSDNWKSFSVEFLSRFSLTTALDGDNINVGIIQFASNATSYGFGNTTLDNFNNTVYSKVQSQLEGGNMIGSALQLAQQQLSGGDKNHGKFIVLMTSRSPPDLDLAISMGQNLSAQNIDIFIVGSGLVSAKGYNDLIKINGNPKWFFNSTDDANDSLPSTVLGQYPCPAPAYYAIETTDSYSTLQSLNYTQQAISQVNAINNGTKYRLLLYTDDQIFLPKAGAATYDEIQIILGDLILNQTYKNYIGQYTTLDDAINNVALDINKITLRNKGLFQSSVIFVGEANYNLLTLGKNSSYRNDLKASLIAAGKNIKQYTKNFYAVDHSFSPQFYGENMWPYVVDQNKTYPFDDNILINLNNSDYYGKIETMSCTPPKLSRCDYYFIDVAIVLDIVGDPTPIKNYVNTLALQFGISYNAHFSMFTMGLGANATMLTKLQSYESSQDFINQSFTAYDSWREAQIQTQTSTTPIFSSTASNKETATGSPSSSTNSFSSQASIQSSTNSPQSTVSVRTTAGKPPFFTFDTIPPITLTISGKKAKEYKAQIEQTGGYPITSAIIQSMFTQLRSQFGCNYTTGDAGDRVMSPNVVILISDNFATYDDNIMAQFLPSIQSNWQCDDCPGKPLFYFAGYNSTPPQHGLGQFVIQAVDTAADISQNTKAVNDINYVIDTVCKTKMPDCLAYAPSIVCGAPPVFV